MDKQSNDKKLSKMRIFFRIFINFDEGFQVFVSKTGLMWSTLMFFIGVGAFQLRNNPSQYTRYIYSLIQIWVIVVVLMGVVMGGIALNYYWIIEEKFGDLNEKKLNRFIWSMKFVSGWLFIIGMLLLILAWVLRAR